MPIVLPNGAGLSADRRDSYKLNFSTHRSHAYGVHVAGTERRTHVTIAVPGHRLLTVHLAAVETARIRHSCIANRMHACSAGPAERHRAAGAVRQHKDSDSCVKRSRRPDADLQTIRGGASAGSRRSAFVPRLHHSGLALPVPPPHTPQPKSCVTLSKATDPEQRVPSLQEDVAVVEAPPAAPPVDLDWDALARELDMKSPLEIMDHVREPYTLHMPQ